MTTKELLNGFTREEGIALFNSKKTDKEVYDLFVSKGLTDSFDTFTAEAQKLFNEKFSKMSKEEILKQIEGAELTDEQLEMVAGGKTDYERGVAEDAGISLGIAIAGTTVIMGTVVAITSASGAAV